MSAEFACKYASVVVYDYNEPTSLNLYSGRNPFAVQYCPRCHRPALLFQRSHLRTLFSNALVRAAVPVVLVKQGISPTAAKRYAPFVQGRIKTKPNLMLHQRCPWVGLTHGLGWFGSGWVEIFQFLVGWVELGQSADGLGWIGSHKMDRQTTLFCTVSCPNPRNIGYNLRQRTHNLTLTADVSAVIKHKKLS